MVKLDKIKLDATVIAAVTLSTQTEMECLNYRMKEMEIMRSVSNWLL